MSFRNFAKIFLVTLTSVIAFSCAKSEPLLKEKSEALAAFTRAKDYSENEKWGKAVKYFSEFVYSYPYHDSIEVGTYLLAESYYNNKDYDLAVSEYRRVAQRFPDSDFAERAELMIGESYLAASPRVELDQSKTEQALEYFKDFIRYHPTSEYLEQARDGIDRCREKLAEKEYKAAWLYLKLRKPESVILYADLIAEEYAETSFVPKALLLKGRALAEQMDRPDEATDIFRDLIEDYPDTEISEEAADRLSKIEG